MCACVCAHVCMHTCACSEDKTRVLCLLGKCCITELYHRLQDDLLKAGGSRVAVCDSFALAVVFPVYPSELFKMRLSSPGVKPTGRLEDTTASRCCPFTVCNFLCMCSLNKSCLSISQLLTWEMEMMKKLKCNALGCLFGFV